MSGAALQMKIIEDVRRLAALNLTDRAIARALKIDRRSVKKYRESPNCEAASKPPTLSPDWQRNLDWDEVIAEVRRGVPVNVVWEELKESGKINVQYPGFWKQLSKRMPENNSSCVRVFTPGERIEIDYCDGINIFDRFTDQHALKADAEYTKGQKGLDRLRKWIK